MKTLIIAPHADDETQESAEHFLKEKQKGNKLYWLVATDPQRPEYPQKFIDKRLKQLKKIEKDLQF